MQSVAKFSNPVYCVDQQSPTFLAPGTSFMEGNFSMEGVAGDGSGVM